MDGRGRALPSLVRAAALDEADLRSGRRAGKVAPRVAEERAREKGVLELLAEERRSPHADDSFARQILRRGSRYRAPGGPGSRSGADEEEPPDARPFAPDAERLSALQLRRRDEQRAVAAYRRSSAAQSRCRFCFGSGAFARALGAERTVLRGPRAALLLSGGGERLSGVDMQCEIVAEEHIGSVAECDEETALCILQLKQRVRQLFAGLRRGVVFLEAALGGEGAHARVQCVPLPRAAEEDARLWFRREIEEVTDDFARNRKLLSLAGRPALRGASGLVPPGFAHFVVEWTDGGFVHTVTDPRAFPSTFGLDVLAGMLKVDPVRFNRHAARERPRDVAEEVRRFRGLWEEHVGELPR